MKKIRILPKIAALAAVLISAVPALANDPGGGAPGGGANVVLTTTSSSAVLNNGIIQATISKSDGKVTSYLFHGEQMLDTGGLIYYSMDGGSSYEQPHNCAFSVKVNTPDMVDISCKQTWSPGVGYIHAFDIDLHYVLRRGDTGLYAYAILSHPANYPDTGVGEWRMVWKLPHDANDFKFERVYVDALRHWYWGTYKDFTSAQSTGIAEVIKLVTGARAGQYDCKYEYAAEYQKIGCWGHASDTNRMGAWMVLGGYDFLNDGPLKNDLTLAESYNLIHFGRNHYNGSGTSVSTNEAWSKIYGPFLLYCNSTDLASGAGDTLWADAKAQVQAEIAAWPYAWLTGNTNYPPESQRGNVTGKFVVVDNIKPGVNGAHAWVGLAQPDPGANWQFESKRYEYWVQADAAGRFTIPHVRPGSYTLSAFTTGAVGEFSTSVTVSAGATNSLGHLIWNVPHHEGRIAWEIGIPDRSAAEFRHGTNYWYPFLWDAYPNEFPNPLDYTIGVSNWSNDWNYAQCGYPDGWVPWKWRVHFDLTNPPTSGNATLTMAWASSDHARMQVFVNSDTAQTGPNLYPSCVGGPTGGNALIREGIHAKYGVDYLTFPMSLLHDGANTVTLVQGRASGASDHVMYDYVNLEIPGVTPPQPIEAQLSISSRADGQIGLSIRGEVGYAYQLQRADSPVSSSWENVGASQDGTGDVLEFTDASSNNNPETFYRVQISR